MMEIINDFVSTETDDKALYDWYKKVETEDFKDPQEIIVLERMMSLVSALENGEITTKRGNLYSKDARAQASVAGIYHIYQQNKGNLTPEGNEKLSININDIGKPAHSRTRGRR